MNTEELYRFMFNLLNGSKCTYDVLPCDQLDNITPRTYPLFLIVNTKPTGHPGEHWTSFFLPCPGGNLEFFCSYGMGMDFYSDNFSKFAKRIGCRVIQNKIPLQSIGTNVCGQYALYFLYKRSKKCPRMSVYCNFSPNTRKNDEKIRRFVVLKNHLLHKNCNFNKTIQCCINKKN
jgi:hypothetical protein